MPGRRIRGVVLDLDGTLVDHHGSVRTALREWLPSIGGPPGGKPNHPPSLAHLGDAWIAAEERHYPAWQAGVISFTEQCRRRLRDFLPLIGHPIGDDDTLDAVFAGYLDRYERAWVPFEDTVQAIDALTEAGLHLALLTNGTVAQQNAKIDAIGLAGRVGPVLTAEELGLAKPDPGSYRAACRRLELLPAQVLHVGDRYDLDVLGARAAGLHAVHLDRTHAGPHDEAARITSLHQLPGYLAALEVAFKERRSSPHGLDPNRPS